MKIAVDTNVLVYFEGINEQRRQDAAVDLIRTLQAAQHTLVVPVQVLAELFSVLVRRSGQSRGQCRGIVLRWVDVLVIQDTTAAVYVRALDLAADHGLAVFDAIILAAAAEAGCRLLLSEDLQDGFTWGGVTVVNPFADPPHPLLPRP